MSVNLSPPSPSIVSKSRLVEQGTLKGKYHCTVDLLCDCFGINCMTINNFRFYLQNRLIQTGQTGGQLYSDTSPFSVSWIEMFFRFIVFD
jgi:hypothetical protein